MNETYEKNSASKEDYLGLIYEFSNSKSDFKAVDIAKRMNISRASVSEALQKLALQGYIIYEKYKPAVLTEKGRILAEKVYNKHRVLCSFFKNYLNLSEEESQINACRIEHVITESAFEKIKEMVESFE